MKRVGRFIKRELDWLTVSLGLGLIIDNWGHNNGWLLFVGAALFFLGLDWFVDNKIREAK